MAGVGSSTLTFTMIYISLTLGRYGPMHFEIIGLPIHLILAR